MKLPSSVALLFSLGTLCFANPANLDEINSGDIDFSFAKFEKEQSSTFDVINEDPAEEEWPEYMEWMCDLKKNVYKLKLSINSVSNGLSDENTQFFYIDPKVNEKSLVVYIYKHKF